MTLARPIAIAVSLAALSGCGSIGDGSTIQSLSIQAAATGSATSPFVVHRCLRDELVAIATFTDGTRADFSYRVTWTSSAPSTVSVSNNDIHWAIVDDGAFTESPALTYRPGTVIPQAASGTATITASFLSLTASMPVSIDTATFRIAPLAPGVNPRAQPPLQRYVGPATTLRYAFFIEQADGQVVLSSTLNALGLLNPILWRFVGGELDLLDTGVTDDFDKYAVPNAASPTAVINALNGQVTGIAPEAQTYQVQASTSLCPADAAFTPTAPLQVAAFATTSPLTLAYESDFNGVGQPLTGDIFAGSNELLTVTGNLDTDGNGIGDQTQDLSDQVDFSITHTTACAAGSTNCTCDTGDVNCSKHFVSNSGNRFFTVVNTDSANASVFACFADLDKIHGDDCEEDAAAEDVALKSGTLNLQSIAVNLSGAGATLAVSPAAPANQPVFTYPGQQFEAYGTFTALEGTPFAGGTSATGTQKLTRSVGFTTRPQGSTTELSDIGFVRNAGDAFFNDIGAFAYLKEVAANTTVDIFITPGAPFTAVTAPTTPVSFTLCPSTGC